MKNFIVLFMLAVASMTAAQESEILPAQKAAISALSTERGFTPESLNEYLMLQWGAPLEKLSRKTAGAVISKFQSDTPPSPSDIHKLRTEQSQTTPKQTQTAEGEFPQRVVLAEFLEKGMSKRFHLVDGNIIQGTLVEIDTGICSIETEDGILKIPAKDILEETAEITKRDGSRYVGPVLKESVEEITLRSKYGDVVVGKREIQDMNRYHGGRLVPWAEERKTFYRGDVVLTDIFFDPTAFPLEPNSLYISALSLGYGFTDNFMVRTSFGNNFSGDLNLQPLYQVYNKRTATNKIAAAIGMDMYSHHDMTSVVAKYARYVKQKSTGMTLDKISSVPVSSVLADGYTNTFYAEIYAVLSHRWSLESGRGEMGYHIGVRTSTLPFNRSTILATDYEWTDDPVGRIPFRLWAAFEYDLTKDLKLASNVWFDNGYRFRTLNQVLEDYFRKTPFILDGIAGEYRTVDFDFGLMYAVNQSLRIGVHFKDPYLVLFWRIVEF